MIDTNVHSAGLPEPALVPLYGQMLAKLQALPGVVSASQCLLYPLDSGDEWTSEVSVPGYQPPSGVVPGVYSNWVTPGYFSTMRTPLLEGRVFAARDSANSTPVVVINQLLANTYFRGQDPIGKHIQLGGRKSETNHSKLSAWCRTPNAIRWIRTFFQQRTSLWPRFIA